MLFQVRFIVQGLSSSLIKLADFYVQIDGKENPLLETVLFDGFPIETAHFSADGDRIIVGSNMYSYFYYYDMLSDKAVKVPRIRCKICHCNI